MRDDINMLRIIGKNITMFRFSQVKCVKNCQGPNCVNAGAEMSFEKPDGWNNIKCSSVLYPDFREPRCHCLGDYDSNGNFVLTP